MSKTPSICVIILNYQSYTDTISFVANIKQQEGIRLKILVVDNCSPNDSFTFLAEEFQNQDDVTVIKSEHNGGYAYGNNFGLRYVENDDLDYILVSNNDIEVQNPNLLYQLTQEYEKLENPAFVSPVMYIDDKIAANYAWPIPTLWDEVLFLSRIKNRLQSKPVYDLSNEVVKVDCLPGSFFMVKKEIFFTLGLMDEGTFLYMEETILGFKVKAQSLNNYLLTTLKFDHANSKTISAHANLAKIYTYQYESLVFFHKKYLKTSTFGLFLLKVIYKLRMFKSTLR